MMNLLKAGFLASAALLVVASGAQASIITTPVQTVTFSQQLTDYTQTGQFALFDTNLGTLQQINFSVSYNETSTLLVKNNTSGPSALASNGSANTQSQISISSSNSAVNTVLRSKLGTTSVANPSGFFTVSILGAEFDYTLDPNSSISGDSSANPPGVKLATDTTQADFAAFKTVGTTYAPLTGTTFTRTVLANNGGNTSATQTTLADGTFTISYQYDDSTAVVVPPPTGVPEPASLALLGAGLLGFGMIRRKSA